MMDIQIAKNFLHDSIPLWKQVMEKATNEVVEDTYERIIKKPYFEVSRAEAIEALFESYKQVMSKMDTWSEDEVLKEYFYIKGIVSELATQGRI